MAPDPALAFQAAQAVPEPVYILHGNVRFDESLLPQGVVNEERNPAPIPGYFRGHALSLEGFVTPFERPVQVQSVCYGPWCGGMGSDMRYLLFATKTDAGLVIEVDPCGGNAFQEPDRAMLDQMTACLQGTACAPRAPLR
jgi:hypothetical protein